ncbi:DUF4270 domain-containing protein [uncultured Mucilaginibacter sp.]|uniref:DUF4270 domain-containing protein n=1 Tax=uncultured Mucilaginibacter sp. TaxID=797541 RepID=UPI00260AF68E|nr:DUF4270 domain-containing protein [uncultured Mucilaginibacter sp.]
MKFSKLGLLTLLISLFILSSCKKPDTVGLAVDPSEVINGTLLDTVSINTTTLRDDSIVTTNLTGSQAGASVSVFPLAYYKDPIFGVTEANAALSLGTPASTAFTRPTGTVTVDSAVLVLRYGRNFYGDTTATNYKLNVYQLNEQPLNQAYYNTKAWAYNPTLIGTGSFHARPNDSVKVLQIVTGAKDTIKKLQPQIRIPVNTAFVKNNILLTDSSKLIGTEAFKRYFKGLYLTFDKAQTTGGPGGNFYLLTDSCALNVYYKNTSSTGTIDTVMASFPASGNYAAQIKHDYTGTAIQAALSNTTSSKTVYLQGLAGLRAKIAFPSLATNVKKLLGNAALNRAELIITPVAGTQIYPFLPAPRLTMYRYNVAKQRTLIPDANSNDTRFISLLPYGFGGFYNSIKNEYHFVITGYIQDLLSGKTIDYGTFLAPADYYNTTSVEYSTGSAYSAGRLVAGGDKTSAYKMKLNIIYTPALVK